MHAKPRPIERKTRAPAALWLAAALCASSGCALLRAPGGEARAPSGSELWAESCGRCHHQRSPTWYGDAQWEVALAHMAIKARLTGDERTAVLAYLQAAN